LAYAPPWPPERQNHRFRGRSISPHRPGTPPLPPPSRRFSATCHRNALFPPRRRAYNRSKTGVYPMARPVVGIIGNAHLINETYLTHAGGRMNSEAVAEVAGCLPLIIPTDPGLVSVGELLEVCDGFLFTGGRPNVHPEEYGEP